MAGADRIPDDEWRLDEEPLERVEPEPPSAAPTEKLAFNLSQVRLTRAVYVVTAEHLGWYIVAAYALITRTIALGARPLDAAQSTDAMTALLIAQHGRARFRAVGYLVGDDTPGLDLCGDRRVRRDLANCRDAMRPAADRNRDLRSVRCWGARERWPSPR